MNVFGAILKSACLSVHMCVRVSICVQNSSLCQSTGEGIKLHLVTVLVNSVKDKFYQFSSV